MIRIKPGCENVWQIDVSVGGQRVQRQYTGLREDAEALEAKLQAEMAQASDDAKPWTLDAAIERINTAQWSQGADPNVLRNAREAKNFFGAQTRIDRISTEDIDSWKEFLREKGNSNATINRKLAALSGTLRFAMERGRLKSLPHIPREEEAEGRIRWLTIEEEGELLRLFTVWSKPDLVDYCAWSIDTGMRPSEMLRLRADHIDLRKQQVHIWKSKNRTARTIPLTNRCLEIARRRIKAGGATLWEFGEDAVQKHWLRAKAHMGLGKDPWFVPYIMRHTFASRLLAADVHLAVIKELMGHNSITTTMRYAHLAPTRGREAILAMSSATPVSAAGTRAASAIPSPSESVNLHSEVDVG